MSRPPVVQFLGATDTVTGSRFLVETEEARVLVDCGLYQGLKQLRRRNWAPFPVDPPSIDAVVLTHAHIDHCGYLPGLVRAGFKGRVYATPNTVDLCQIVLPDAAHLQEEDARYANRHGYSKHKPALPLFNARDAEVTLSRLEPLDFEVLSRVARGIDITLQPAGHILGSASVLLESGSTRVVFSGDLGRREHPILMPPSPLPECDTLLIESTYGDREHREGDPIPKIAEVIRRTVERRGVVLIPAFAVDRSELILLHLKRLVEAGEIPEVPIYVDSPMALSVLQVYRRAIAECHREIRAELHGAGDPFDAGNLIEARKLEDSIAVQQQEGPAIVISASGMATGGRVLHHLAHRLPDPRNAVLFVGFQAAGTRGRLLVEGRRTLKLLGRYVQVRAEVIDVSDFSVHADHSELLDWIKTATTPPGTTYVVHGEPHASAFLRDSIEREVDTCAVVPNYLERVEAGGD